MCCVGIAGVVPSVAHQRQGAFLLEFPGCVGRGGDPTMARKKKINRTIEDMIARLKEHCALLREYHDKACRAGERRYLGEIAGKLRLLTYKSGSNQPLLLDLMKALDIPVSFDTIGVFPERGICLEKYLEGTAIEIRVADKVEKLSRLDLIALWSQQSGSAHEDWALEPRLSAVFQIAFFVNGQPGHGLVLCGICRTVLHVANEFLNRVDSSPGTA